MAKLTSVQLRKIVQEEVGKFGKMGSVEDRADDAVELDDAGDYADTLEKQVDIMKALKIEESRLRNRLVKIQEQKSKIARLLAR